MTIFIRTRTWWSSNIRVHNSQNGSWSQRDWSTNLEQNKKDPFITKEDAKSKGITPFKSYIGFKPNFVQFKNLKRFWFKRDNFKSKILKESKEIDSHQFSKMFKSFYESSQGIQISNFI